MNLREQLFTQIMATKNLPRSLRENKKYGRKRDYSPLDWTGYFDQKIQIQVAQDTFNVYTLGKEGPLLVLLHGGGYSGLTWSLFAARIIQMARCQVMAIDLRGHGDTCASNELDLSADRLCLDVEGILNQHYHNEPPPLIVIGHSMGGAIGIHAVSKNHLPTCEGLVVIDVVEGTALDALHSMQSFLRGRPPTFQNMEIAIEWCVRSGQVSNVESARVSMPGQLKKMTANKETAAVIKPPIPVFIEHSIMEEDEPNRSQPSVTNQSESEAFDSKSEVPQSKLTWRIDLMKTEPFWEGWFKKLSTTFLSCNVPKLLLLAGVDRLDKEMTIAQMQGKFQMQILSKTGHAVHEDDPDQVAQIISNFIVRHKIAEEL